jgi:RNA polymerase sigma-70 factor (ECF subfamily)
MMTLESSNDEVLARQAQQGNREAFLILYHRYLNKVYNRVRTRVPVQDVDDVVQEIFIAVVRSLGGFEQRAQFNTWLYTIVNRQIADHYRRQYRVAKGEQDDITLDDLDRRAKRGTSEHERIDLTAQVQRALSKLPQHYQDIIVMRFVDQYSFQEIAERRAQTLEAVKSLFRRALQAIRSEIGDAL